MTVPVSNIYSLYIEEKKETSPADGGRDRRKRQPRQLSNERAEIQDKAFALLSELYPRHHPGHMELPNPGSVRSALRNFLLDNPKWGEQQVLDGIRNYYGSANTNKRTSPERWIKRIPEFSAGPLDQYGRPAGPVLVPMRVGRRSEYAPPRAAPPGAPDNYRVPDEDIQIPF